MKVLVTGGSGFLGSSICEELEHRGHHVVALDLVPPSSSLRKFVEADVRDLSALRDAMKDSDAVYHCAGIADLDANRRSPRLATEVNINGTLNALEGARDCGVRRFLYASSVYVFSRGGSIYRTTKQAAENLVRDLADEWDIQTTILRFGSLYGPHADSSNAILRIVKQALLEGRIDFWGDGSEIREYVHVGDAATLAVNALEDTFSGQSLHITGRERLATREIIEMINEMLGGNIVVSMHDEPFEGRYRLTPYSFESSDGRRITGETYMDLGLGILNTIRSVNAELARESGQ